MTYQESHFPSNQADFRLVLGMVAFSPSSPLPKALSCLPCDVCPIFCHSEVIHDQAEPVRGSLAVCNSRCLVHPEDVTSGTLGSALGFNYGCCSLWLPLTRGMRSQRGVLSFHSSTPWQLCPTGAFTQIPSLALAEGLLSFPPPLQLYYLVHFSPMCLKSH